LGAVYLHGLSPFHGGLALLGHLVTALAGPACSHAWLPLVTSLAAVAVPCCCRSPCRPVRAPPKLGTAAWSSPVGSLPLRLPRAHAAPAAPVQGQGRCRHLPMRLTSLAEWSLSVQPGSGACRCGTSCRLCLPVCSFRASCADETCRALSPPTWMTGRQTRTAPRVKLACTGHCIPIQCFRS
jgi:hypothetical protein